MPSSFPKIIDKIMGSGSNLSSSSTAVGLAVIQTSRTESKRVSDPLKKPRMQNLLMNTNLKKKKERAILNEKQLQSFYLQLSPERVMRTL